MSTFGHRLLLLPGRLYYFTMYTVLQKRIDGMVPYNRRFTHAHAIDRGAVRMRRAAGGKGANKGCISR